MKVSPVSFASKSNLKTNNYSKNPISSFLKQENDVFVSSKKVLNQSFLGLFSKNPILSKNQVSNDETTNEINEVYQQLDKTIALVEKGTRQDVRKLKSLVAMARKEDFKGYIKVFGMMNGKDGLLHFGDFDETNTPSKLDLSFADNPFKVIQSYTFDCSLSDITRTYKDNGIESYTVGQNGKPLFASQHSAIDNNYQEFAFYPNGLITVVLGQDVGHKEKDSQIFFTLDRKNPSNCHYFELERDGDKFEHYIYDKSTKKWELAEKLSGIQAQETFENLLTSIVLN